MVSPTHRLKIETYTDEDGEDRRRCSVCKEPVCSCDRCGKTECMGQLHAVEDGCGKNDAPGAVCRRCVELYDNEGWIMKPCPRIPQGVPYR